MQKITIIGSGNIAWHLKEAIAKCSNYKVSQLVGRANKPSPYFVEIPAYTNNIEQLVPTDIIIIAVSDTAIADVAKKLVNTSALVVHTSGSVPLSILEKLNHHGVLYPLQTFTKGRIVNLQKVPFCIEANNTENLKEVRQLASAFSEKIEQMDSIMRAKLHFSAVLANNFGNHLLALTESYCNDNNLSFELLKPLLMETTSKAFDMGAMEAQTGPARRDDKETIKKQLAVIDNDQLRQMYKTITNSILTTYGKEKL